MATTKLDPRVEKLIAEGKPFSLDGTKVRVSQSGIVSDIFNEFKKTQECRSRAHDRLVDLTEKRGVELADIVNRLDYTGNPVVIAVVRAYY